MTKKRQWQRQRRRRNNWITNSVLHFRNPDDSSILRMMVDTSPWSASSVPSAPSAPSAPQPLWPPPHQKKASGNDLKWQETWSDQPPPSSPQSPLSSCPRGGGGGGGGVVNKFFGQNIFSSRNGRKWRKSGQITFSQGSRFNLTTMPGPTAFHHVVHADDRDAVYNVGGLEWLWEPVFLNPNRQKLTFENQ